VTTINISKISSVLGFGVMLCLLTADLAVAQLSGFDFRKRFQVNSSEVSGSNDLNNFPVLISITDPDFRSVGNGGNVENPNGFDIAFTSSDGNTQLDHQLEFYDAATGEITAWVRFPILFASSNTEFFIYYGNNSISTNPSVNSTFESNYQLVTHLNNTVNDVSQNSFTGTPNATTAAGGFIAGGRAFNGNASDFISYPDNPSLDITGDITFSLWINPSSINGPDLLTKGAYDDSYGAWFNNFGFMRFQTNANALNGNNAISAGNWTYLTFVKSSSGRQIYINGSLDANDGNATNFNANNDNLTISSSQFPFDGLMDEIRISSTARSADWIATEFTNQNTPGSFISEIPEAPVLSNIESNNQIFNAGGSPVFLTASITVSDPFASQLQSATIQITGNYVSGEDELLFTDQNGISGSFNTATGTLSLSGAASLADYEAALRSVQYNNINSANPDLSTRTISFTVNNGSQDSNTLSRNLNIIGTISDASTDIPNVIFHFDGLDVNGDLSTANQPPDGSTVAVWGDRSDDATGSGTDLSASAPSASQEPLFNSLFFGERGALRWDGANDAIAPPNDNTLNTNTFTEKSFGVVFRTGDNTSGLQVVYEQGAGVRGYQISIKDGNVYAYTWNTAEWPGGEQHKSINIGSAQPNETYIVIASHDATSGTLADRTWSASLNGGAVQTLINTDIQRPHGGGAAIGFQDGTLDPVTFSNAGGSSNFEGTIAELLSWNTALNDGLITSLFNYFDDKWGNSPPVLSSIESTNLDYNEGSAPVSITSSLTVSDSDNTLIDSAYVTISGNFISSEDVLSFTPAGNISGSFNSTTGRLTLTGQDTKANYESVLRSVSYENTNTTDPSTDLRQVDFLVFDWDDQSNTASRNISIITSNASPVLANMEGSTINYNEGDGPVTITSSITVSDPDDTLLEGAVVLISANYATGEDVLRFTNQNGITGSFNSTNEELTLTGSASVADYETALRSVRFENISANPSTNTRTVSFTVSDSQLSSNTVSRDIQISSQNTEPVLTNIESDPVIYDGQPTALTQQIIVSDPDNAFLNGASISISSNYDPAQDSLLFDPVFGITGNWNTITGVLSLSGNASLSDYQTALRTIRYSNFAATPSGLQRQITFSVNDGSLSSTSVTRLLNVNPVQSLPDLKVWLRADQGLSLSGSEVISWQDQSGNGNDYTAIADGGIRPTIVNSAAELNNQPAVNFAGDGDHFEDADGDVNYINGTTEFTLFVVIKSDQTNTDRGFWVSETPVGEDKTFTIRYDQSGANEGGAFSNVIKTGILSNSPANQIESNSNTQTTSGQIIGLNWKSGTLFDIYLDGILNNPSAAGPPPAGTITSASTAILGKGGKDDPDINNISWDGLIAEFILYCRSLTDEERRNVEDYLSEKYGLPIRKISPAAGGEAISADDANTNFTTLSGPVFQEGVPGELEAGENLILTAPSGFEWNTAAVPTVTASPAFGGSTTLSASFVSATANTLTFTIDASSGTNPGQLEFGNLQVRPTTGTLPNTGNITNTGSTGLGGNTNYGTLTMVAGVRDSLIFIQQPSNTTLNDIISPAVRVQLTDQFGNNVADNNVPVVVNLSTGTGTLSGTLTKNTNTLGIAAFDDLSVDQTGTKQISAQSTGISAATSANFEVVNTGEFVKFIVEQEPSGVISTKLAGQDFGIRITAVDGSGNTVNSFNGSASITSDCAIGTGQGTTPDFTNGVLTNYKISITNTGSCSLTATNTSGSEKGTSNTFLVNPGPASVNTSEITASPTVIINDGLSTSLITVQLKDSEDNNVETGGETVGLTTDEGTLSNVTDSGDGTYTATLTSSTNITTATITGTLNGTTIADNAQVEFAVFSHIWESQLGDTQIASNWNNADNWNSGTVPDATSVVLIPADPAVGNEFPVSSNTGITVAQIAIEESAELQITGGTNFTVNGGISGAGIISGSNTDSLTVGGNLDISSLTLGNVIFNGTNDQTITNPHDYVNMEINNTGTVNASENLTVSGILNLTNGELLIPSGANLLANDKNIGAGRLRFQRIISGIQGWRMLSSPVASTFGDFLDGTLTQGFTGSTLGADPADSLQPNVLYYDETFPGTDNQRFRAPSNISEPLTAAQGMFVFFFGDIPADPRYNNPLPDTLDVTGQEYEGNGSEVDFNVTYTAQADTGWNLVGNPYGATINWDHPSWTKNNIESAIYVWDPNANGGNGEYLTWNGVTGTLGSGLIAPFQGFWIKATGPGASLIVSEDAKTTGGNFLRKENPAQSNNAALISLELNAEGLSKQTNIMLSGEAREGKDLKDAFEITPFSVNRLELFTLLEDGTPLAINNLPIEFENRYRIPLDVRGFINGQPIASEFVLNVRGLRNIPDNWVITLFDQETQQEINLLEQDSYRFTHSTQQKLKMGNPGGKGKIVQKENSLSTRFTLIISTEEIEANVPQQIFLEQNYPNPFNPTTVIPFGLDETSDVKLEIFDVLGRKIQTLVDSNLAAGRYDIRFDAGNLASGVYIYRLITNEKVLSRKLVLIR